MNNELIYLNILLNKDSYNQFFNDIDLNYIKENFREIYYLYEVLKSLHEKHDVDFQLGDLISAFWAKYPDADKVIYERLFKTLSETQVTPDVGLDTLRQIKRRKQLLKLSETVFRNAQGLCDDSELKHELDLVFNEAPEEPGALPFQPVTTKLSELIDAVYSKPGLRWRLGCLNKSLGSLRKGDFGFIFARPETGKTTFLASEITHFLTQTDNPIVWINNEEQGSKVMMRVYQAYFGVPMDTLLSNIKRFEEEFEKRTDGRFYLFDESKITWKQVEKIISKLNPELVVYDQLPKIKGFKADRNDLLLGEIFQWARELAKGSHAAIGVSQADGTAENVRYLTMDHVANVKTAAQAEADWILGVGKVHDESQEYVRFLNISKNKLFGDKDSDPSLKHGKFETIIEPLIARYKDVISYK